LGLISMRERIHLAGGEFANASKLGEGTRITARVPIAGKQ
jgi:signal transduction histidine kinase